jgi:release factor glutamine methyltransferase
VSIKEALKKYSSVEIDLLLSHILGKPREFLYMNGEHKLTRIQADRLTRMERRREKGEPVAYILGYKDFYGLRFKVNKNVLIPRPESEWLVDRVLSCVIPSRARNPLYWENRKLSDPSDPPRMHSSSVGMTPIKILDVGTGSGCIAISLAKELTQNTKHKTQIIASDISWAAIKVAKQNTRIHRVKIKFIHSDILQNVRMNFDIIVANLPYLPSEASTKEGGWSELKNNTSAETAGLKFEPKQALHTKEKGLMQIRRLLEQIALLKQKPKLAYFEFDPRQKQDLHKLIKKILPEMGVKFYKDFNGLWRFTEISLR